MHYVYLLQLDDKSYYTGSTDNLPARVVKHNRGDVQSTKSKRPVDLVFYCSFKTKQNAVNFEKYLKTGSGQAFRNKHLI